MAIQQLSEKKFFVLREGLTKKVSKFIRHSCSYVAEQINTHRYPPN